MSTDAEPPDVRAAREASERLRTAVRCHHCAGWGQPDTACRTCGRPLKAATLDTGRWEDQGDGMWMIPGPGIRPWLTGGGHLSMSDGDQLTPDDVLAAARIIRWHQETESTESSAAPNSPFGI